jgi:ribosomal protein S12 methylthiotransferase
MEAKIAYHIVSLGCAKNKVDSENIMGLLQESDAVFTPDPSKAAVIIVNTCGFIESAREESIGEILKMARYKKMNCKVLLVAGCMPARHKMDLFKEIPELDGLVTPANLHHIPAMVRRGLEGEKTFYLTDTGDAPPGLPRQVTGSCHSVYLKIADGCNHRCAFCVIPHLRGPYKSRPLEDLMREAAALVDAGAREINLVAQDTTYYGMDMGGRRMLPELLESLCQIPRLSWIRILYAHPLHVDNELLECIEREKKVCSYLDIPLQHASRGILKDMKRGATDVGAVLEACREAVPGIVLRSTFIVGFPGERSRHFQELLEFLAKHSIERVGIFQFSPEEGTPAAKDPRQVPARIKRHRYHEAMASLQEISRTANRKLLGNELEVLVDGQREDGLYVGRYYGQAPEVDGFISFPAKSALKAGDLVQVIITRALDYDLEGEMRE